MLALLLAELAILALIVGVLASPLTPRLIAEEAEGRLSPRLAPALAQSPPDAAGIERELTNPPADPESQEFTPALPPDNGYLFVVDEERRLMASNQPLPETAEDERLAQGEFPELEPLLSQTLGEGSDPWQQGAYSSDWQRLLISAPIEGEDGETLGAVAAVVRL
ncbi:MAG: PDC sensor domain-containing protein, partial [Rubrobacter sp.]|nr:PDC sensor domain-containing protein [Rubrobacter sp.]